MVQERRYRVLFVDDNEGVLQSMQRQFRKQFDVLIANSGQTGIDLLAAERSVAVVVADMRMPGMDGVEFLRRVQETSSSTVRVMLTGNVDQTTTIRAINEGKVFRFLTKPVDQSALLNTLLDACEIYRLRIAEQELLNDTVKGVVALLSELISFIDPELYGFSSTLQLNVREVAKQLNVTDAWELEVAALVSKIGTLALPLDLRTKLEKGQLLTNDERESVDRHPESGSAFLKAIPRLESVSRMVLYQSKNFDGTGFPVDDVKGEEIPLGARVLRVLQELHALSGSESNFESLFSQLEGARGVFDPEVLEAVKAAFLQRADHFFGAKLKEPANEQQKLEEAQQRYTDPEECLIEGLEVGMIPIKEIRAKSGVLLLQPGAKISEANLERVKGYHRFPEFVSPCS
ncbi:MAG: response regulator [Bdellovibrionales bacterium]|nr:response regulator [Bdellovibrionales bacterium]